MQFTKLMLTVAGIFAAAIQAAPTVPSLQPSTLPNGPCLAKVTNDLQHHNETDTVPLPKLTAGCRNDWDYENSISKASPFVTDCWQLYNNIKNDGFWYTKTGHHTIATYDTCAYGIETVPKSLIVMVGNEDVRLTIKKAISKFADSYPGEQPKVGAWGQMKCDIYTVKWSIYHT